MLYAKVQEHQTSSSEEEYLKGFHYLWTWPPSLSCDLEHLYNRRRTFERIERTNEREKNGRLSGKKVDI